MPDDIHARLKRLRKAGRKRRRPVPRGPEARPEASAQTPVQPPAPAHDARADAGDLAQLPGMEERESAWGRYLLRTVRFPLTHQQGRVSLGEVLGLDEDAVRMLVEARAFDFRRAAFLDTETSGLAGGAGTIVFLTGVGAFEGDSYVVRQYFARNPAEERAYLLDLARFLLEREGLVTFNGRSFDWPLLRTRFILTGVAPPDPEPHLDLLIPARRLWRPRLGACNFGNLEQRILDHQRSGLDIPSWLIPSLWFRFARGEGSVREMEAVLYHNQEDIVSMAPLAHVLAATLAGVHDPHPHDWLALARIYARAGQLDRAESAYRRALDHPLPPALRAQAMRELAALLKRADRRDEAAVWWQALAKLLPADIEALVELAKYYEWHVKDVEKARAMTGEAIRRAQAWRNPVERTRALEALEHRLARLRRK